jgi:hypothetical protein
MKSQTILAACMMLFLAEPALAIGKPYKNFQLSMAGEEKPAKKARSAKAKAKSFSSLNNNAVKIYPDAVKRMMHVSAKENDGKTVEFFVFDLEGNLVSNYKMKSRDHIRIQGLAKGSYVYRVFNGDEETAAGKFEIK